MSLNFINVILLFAATQGMLLALVIYQKHRRLYANRFLGSLMLFYSIILLNMLLTDLAYNYKIPHLVMLLNGLPFLIGPMHFLYATSLIRPKRRIGKTDLLHFLPFLLYEIVIMPIYFKSTGELVAALVKEDAAGISIVYTIFNWLVTMQGLTYLLLTFRILRKYSNDIKKLFSTIEKIRLDWLRNITLIFIFVIIVFTIENLFMLGGVNLSHNFNLTSILFAAAFYTMGYLGLLRSEIFSEPQFAESIDKITEFDSPGGSIFSSKSITKKYQKSGLSPEKAKQHLQELLKLMKEEKPYRDSNLTLNQLAERLSISSHNLSEILNTHLHQNFFDFINVHRVEEVKRALADPTNQHLKILAVAFDAGFNSKTSFNTIFKKHTHMTPSEYRQKFSK